MTASGKASPGLFVPRKNIIIPTVDRLTDVELANYLAIERWANNHTHDVTAGGTARARSFDAFTPGTLSARTVMKYNPISGANLVAFDAYMQTAPSTVDASNHIAMKISGASYGSATKGFATVGTKEYHLTDTDLSGIAVVSTTRSGNSGYMGRGKGHATRFTATAGFNVNRITFSLDNGVCSAPLRVGLSSLIASTDGVRTDNNSIPWLTTDNGQPCFVDIPVASQTAGSNTATLPGTKSIAQNDTFCVVFAQQGTDSGIGTGCMVTIGAITAAGNASLNNQTAANPIVYSTDVTTDARFKFDFNTNNGTNISMFGNVSGVQLGGAITVELVAVGTGGGAGPGADVMMSFQF